MQRRGTQAFPGGVHPTDGSDKALSMDQAVKPTALTLSPFCRNRLSAGLVSLL